MVAKQKQPTPGTRERLTLKAAGVGTRGMPSRADLNRLAAVFGSGLTGRVERDELWNLVGLPHPRERSQADFRAVGKKMKEYGWEKKIILKSVEVPYPVYQKGTPEEREVQIYMFENQITGMLEVRRDSP